MEQGGEEGMGGGRERRDGVGGEREGEGGRGRE